MACSTTIATRIRKTIRVGMTSTTTTSTSMAATAAIATRERTLGRAGSRFAGKRLGPAHGCKAYKRYRGKCRGHGEHGCVGATLRDEREHERCDRLHHQVRPSDAAHEMAVTGCAEQRERHRPARDGEKAIRHSEQQRETRR